MTREKSPEIFGRCVSTSPAITSPVAPSIDRTSSCVKIRPLTRICAGRGVDPQFAGPGHTTASPTTGDDGRMACHAAGAGQDPRRAVHAIDVLGTGLLADEQDLFTGTRPLHRLFRGERGLTDRRTWRCRQADGQDVRRLLRFGRKTGQQELDQIGGRHSPDADLLA